MERNKMEEAVRAELKASGASLVAVEDISSATNKKRHSA
jgi:hypothetical protein